MQEEPTTSELGKILAPFLAGTVIVTIFLVMLVLKFAPGVGSLSSPSVVTFDVIKYTNAQRAVASAFLKKDADIGTANELLLNLPQRTREAIEEVAGAGTLVVIKQSVVQGQTEDITDKVLKKLSLPTNVPTADGVQYSLDMAPTMLMGGINTPARKPLAGEGAPQQTDKVLP